MSLASRLRGRAWILPTLCFGVLTWLSFLLAGSRARHRPWLAWAGVYAAGLIASVLLSPGDGSPQEGTWRDAASALLLVAVWLGGFGHALLIHPRYVAWCAAATLPVHQGPWAPGAYAPGSYGSGPYSPGSWGAPGPAGPWQAPPPAWQTGIPQLGLPEVHQPWPPRPWPGPQSGPPVYPPGQQPPPVLPQPPRPAPPVGTLHLATATVEELTAVPAVGPVLARRIVAERAAHGDDLTDLDLLEMGFPPHVVASLRRHVLMGSAPLPVAPTHPRPAPVPPPGRGRVLDV